MAGFWRIVQEFARIVISHHLSEPLQSKSTNRMCKMFVNGTEKYLEKFKARLLILELSAHHAGIAPLLDAAMLAKGCIASLPSAKEVDPS